MSCLKNYLIVISETILCLVLSYLEHTPYQTDHGARLAVWYFPLLLKAFKIQGNGVKDQSKS